MVLVLVGTGCSSGDSDDDASTPGDDEQIGDVGTITDMEADFDVGSLPDDFPPELMPDSFAAGMYAELGNVRNINFESAQSFDDVVAEYTAKIGEDPIIAEAEERLASWTVGVWIVSVIEGTPTLIGVATAG